MRLNRPETLDGATILLTGATGLFGGEILRCLLDHEISRVFCLVRPGNGSSALDAVHGRLVATKGVTSIDERITPILGDVTLSSLGLSCDLLRTLQTKCAPDPPVVPDFRIYLPHVLPTISLEESLLESADP